MNEIKCPNCGEEFSIEETYYNLIIKQIRDKEFSKELKLKEAQFDKDMEHLLQLSKMELQKEFDEELADKDTEIVKLKAKIETNEASFYAKLKSFIAEKDKEVGELQNKLANFNKDKDLEIANIMTDMSNKLTAQENFILKLTNESELAVKEYKLREQNIKEQYESQLRFKDEEIERYKDFKAKLSTKMLGESLEQHCEIAFEQLRATGFKTAKFGKDNNVKSGSKGDYIYRDYDNDGNELISIMFEMKNEGDTTSSKKKNADFLKELDKDRHEKGCEYAILVSMLETENELYNNGIVDMSHHYEKMYVVRPQFFIIKAKASPLNSLRNAVMHFDFNTYQINRERWLEVLIFWEKTLACPNMKYIHDISPLEKNNVSHILRSLSETYPDFLKLSDRLVCDMFDDVAFINGWDIKDLPEYWTIGRTLYSLKRDKGSID